MRVKTIIRKHLNELVKKETKKLEKEITTLQKIYPLALTHKICLLMLDKNLNVEQAAILAHSQKEKEIKNTMKRAAKEMMKDEKYKGLLEEFVKLRENKKEK